MTFILELVRTPIVVCVLSAVVGVGLGLGYDADRRVTAVVPIAAAMAAGVLVGALANEASLATPTVTLGFIVTILVRGARARRRSEYKEVED